MYGPKQKHHSYHSNANWPYANQINCFNHNANEWNEWEVFFSFIFLMNFKCYPLFMCMMTVKCGPRNTYRCMAKDFFYCFNKNTAVFRSIIIVSTFVGVFLFRMSFFFVEWLSSRAWRLFEVYLIVHNLWYFLFVFDDLQLLNLFSTIFYFVQ